MRSDIIIKADRAGVQARLYTGVESLYRALELDSSVLSPDGLKHLDALYSELFGEPREAKAMSHAPEQKTRKIRKGHASRYGEEIDHVAEIMGSLTMDSSAVLDALRNKYGIEKSTKWFGTLRRHGYVEVVGSEEGVAYRWVGKQAGKEASRGKSPSRPISKPLVGKDRPTAEDFADVMGDGEMTYEKISEGLQARGFSFTPKNLGGYVKSGRVIRLETGSGKRTYKWVGEDHSKGATSRKSRKTDTKDEPVGHEARLLRELESIYEAAGDDKLHVFQYVNRLPKGLREELEEGGYDIRAEVERLTEPTEKGDLPPLRPRNIKDVKSVPRRSETNSALYEGLAEGTRQEKNPEAMAAYVKSAVMFVGDAGTVSIPVSQARYLAELALMLDEFDGSKGVPERRIGAAVSITPNDLDITGQLQELDPDQAVNALFDTGFVFDMYTAGDGGSRLTAFVAPREGRKTTIAVRKGKLTKSDVSATVSGAYRTSLPGIDEPLMRKATNILSGTVTA